MAFRLYVVLPLSILGGSLIGAAFDREFFGGVAGGVVVACVLAVQAKRRNHPNQWRRER